LNERFAVSREARFCAAEVADVDQPAATRATDAKGRQGDRMKPAARPRDWRRIHHSPMFWIGVVLCLSAIMIYVLSDDLAWRPASSGR
jgi:hypothetical protein